MKTTMKKLGLLSSFTLTGLMVLASCGSTWEGITATKENKAEIGILQFVTHDALDLARIGFVEALEEAGFVEGENININIQNPQTNSGALATMASSLATSTDLILAIATPAATAVKSALETEGRQVPLLFTAVTDPVAAQLIESPTKPGGFVTGTNDMQPIREQIDLFLELGLVPGVDKIGMIYCNAESNSITQINIAKAHAESLGFSVELTSIPDASTLVTALESLTNRHIKGLYVPTDNVISSNMQTLSNHMIDHQVLTVVGETSMAENGGFITLGADYHALGFLTGQMAVEIIEGTHPQDIASVGASSFEMVINLDVASAMAFEVPSSLLDEADVLIQTGQ